jgi:hypothetical protein
MFDFYNDQSLIQSIIKKIKNNIKKRHYSNNMTDNKCIFILTRGPRKGEKCSKNCIGGKFYCKPHCPKEIPIEKHNEKKEQLNELENQKINCPIYIIRKNKFGNFTFENTGLVFKNISDKKIVAREGENGVWLELTDEDIDLCKQYKLKYERIKFTKNFDSKKYTSSISLFDKPIVFEKELQSNNDLRFEEHN